MSSKKRLLIVDDEKSFSESLRLYLQMEDYQVDVANSGSEGLKLVDENTYSLIISDVLMPEMDGYEFRRIVRSREDTRKVPVIMLTAREADVESLKELNDGATSFIMKPFEHTILLDEIQHLITHRGNRELA